MAILTWLKIQNCWQRTRLLVRIVPNKSGDELHMPASSESLTNHFFRIDRPFLGDTKLKDVLLFPVAYLYASKILKAIGVLYPILIGLEFHVISKHTNKKHLRPLQSFVPPWARNGSSLSIDRSQPICSDRWRIWFSSLSAWSIPDVKVESWQKFWPTGLTTTEKLHSGKVLQILVIGNELNGVRWFFQFKPAVFKCPNNGHQLVVIDFIVVFSRGMLTRELCNRL